MQGIEDDKSESHLLHNNLVKKKSRTKNVFTRPLSSEFHTIKRLDTKVMLKWVLKNSEGKGCRLAFQVDLVKGQELTLFLVLNSSSVKWGCQHSNVNQMTQHIKCLAQHHDQHLIKYSIKCGNLILLATLFSHLNTLKNL